MWGLPKATTEAELIGVLEQAGLSVRSVVFDPKQETVKTKVALVRFPPPPLPWQTDDGSEPESDIIKIADSIVAQLKTAQPELQLHGEKLHCEKTMAEVRPGFHFSQGVFGLVERP